MPTVEVPRGKFAILSHVLPPSPSGQAAVLSRLLVGQDPTSYCLIKSGQGQVDIVLQGTGSKLDQVLSAAGDSPSPSTKKPSPFRRLLAILVSRLPLSLWRISVESRRIASILRSEGCEAMVACTGRLEDIPSSYLASRAVRIPFIAYYFDWYGYQWPTRPARALALWFESMMIENSSAVVVPNEALRDALEKRYGVRAVVIYNPCDERALAVPPVLEWPIGQDEVRIVYTGAVYHAHYDAFRNLATALRDPLLSRARLHIYSSQPPAVLDSQGIEGPVAFHPHLVLDDMLAVQRRADILFLPLAFESTIDEVIRTSAPGKLGEYLASGRPILVHAPPDSFVSQYFRMHRCGVVVDTNSPGDLADGIRWIMEDQEMRRSIVRNAVERARQDFSPRKAREMFEQVLQGADQG